MERSWIVVATALISPPHQQGWFHAWYLVVVALAAAYLFWRAFLRQLFDDWRSVKKRMRPAQPADSDAGDPPVRIGNPGGQFSTTPLTELEPGEHSRLTRVVPTYGIWNDDPTNPIEHVVSGARTRDGRDVAFHTFFQRRIAGRGHAIVQALDSLPADWIRDVHESSAFTDFLYWVRFTWQGGRWEAVHDPQTNSDWFQRIAIPMPELRAHMDNRSGGNSVIRIINAGTTMFWNVDAVLPPEATNWQLMTEVLPCWPLDELAPDDSVTVPVVVAMGPSAALKLRVRGHSELGPYERSFTISVHD
jgi:hypothetical protein